MTNFYEMCFIARQDLTPAQVSDLTDQLVKLIEGFKGKIHKTEDWGQRTLAYRIKKNRKGHYMLLEFEAPAEAVLELNRVMGLNEEILRFMTVRLDELSDGPSPQVQKADDTDGEYKGKPKKEFKKDKDSDKEAA